MVITLSRSWSLLVWATHTHHREVQKWWTHDPPKLSSVMQVIKPGPSARFGQMTKITTVKFFRLGKPLGVVDTVQTNKIAQMIAKFITRVERNLKQNTSWLKIKPLIKPVVAVASLPRTPTPRPPVVSSSTNYRKRRRELERLQRQRRQQEVKRPAEMVEAEKKKVKNSDARRQRFVHKTVNERVANLKHELYGSVTARVAELKNQLNDVLQEQMEHMKENLEDLIRQKCKMMQATQPRRTRRNKKLGPPPRQKAKPVKPAKTPRHRHLHPLRQLHLCVRSQLQMLFPRLFRLLLLAVPAPAIRSVV